MSDNAPCGAACPRVHCAPNDGAARERGMSERKQVIIYTDGACVGNPGPGGWSAVLLCGEARREISGGFRRTTNNRMELLAAIEALRALREPCDVTIYSDSRYVVDG